jgi:hypothetical protein
MCGEVGNHTSHVVTLVPLLQYDDDDDDNNNNNNSNNNSDLIV